MKPPIYVAGDVHLRNGSDKNPFLGFLDLLATRTPSHLVILGDLFDYWLETDRTVREFQAIFAKFQILKQAGWRLDLVMGNRELSAGSRLRLACGVNMHWPDLTLKIGEKRLRIVHGDRICYDPPYHLMAALLRGFWSKAFHASMPAPVHHAIARFIRNHSKGSAKTPSSKRYLKKVFIDPRRVAAHLKHCDTLIAGHIHQVIQQQVRGVDLLVVGDWQGRLGHWIEINALGEARMCQGSFDS